MNANPELNPLELFEHVYATPRTAIDEQRDALEAELAQHDTGTDDDATDAPAHEAASLASEGAAK